MVNRCTSFLLILSLLLGLVVSGGVKDDQSKLQQIKLNIQNQQALSASVLGDSDAWTYLVNGLSVVGNGPSNSLSITNVDIEISEKNNRTELELKAQASIWATDNTNIDVVFYYNQGVLDFYFNFQATLTSVPAKLVPSTGSDWFNGLSLTGNNQVTFATSSFVDNNGKSFQQGLTIVTSVQTTESFPADSDLKKLTNGGVITATMTATFPLITSEPSANFKLQIPSPIYFGTTSVDTTDLLFSLQISNSPSASLDFDIHFNTLSSTVVTFGVTATYDHSNGFSFSGSQQGTWNNVLGLSWFSLSQVVVGFSYNPSSANPWSPFQFDGQASIEFSSQASGTSVNFMGDLGSGLKEISIEISVPIDDITLFFDKVIGQQPQHSSDLSVQGSVDLTVSTYAHGSYLTGLTAAGDIQIKQSSSLAQTVQTVSGSANLEFSMNFYAPIFSSDPSNINFAVQSKGSFTITPNVQISQFAINFALSPQVTTSFSGSLSVLLSQQTTPIIFSISANIEPLPVKFNGQIQGSWDSPFGLQWLKLSDVSSTVTFTNGSVSSFEIQGTVSVTFATATTSASIQVTGPQLHDWTFSVGLTVPSIGAMLGEMSPGIDSPPLAESVSLSVTLTISSDKQPGVTISGNAAVTANSPLANSVQAVAPNSPLNYQVSLYVPVFSSNPQDIQFSLSQTGTWVVSETVSINDINLSFDVTPTVKVTMETTGNLLLANNNSPLSFDLSGELFGISMVSLSGQVKGTWNSPFGLSWLTVNNIQGNFQFENKQLQSIQMTGDSTFTFVKNTDNFDITFQIANDFKNVMFEAKDASVVSYSDVISSIGFTVPTQIASIKSLSNSIDLVFSTYDSSSFKRGLSISDTVSITGELANELAIFNGKGQLNTVSFTLGLILPVFDLKSDIEIYLSTSSIPIDTNMVLSELKLQVDTVPLSISLDTGIQVTFINNPQLLFNVDGTLKADGSVELGGDMVGTWQNMFGITGLNLTDTEILVGFNPALCAVDLCLSALGIGYNITIGTKQIGFYGYAEIPEIQKIFIEGTINGNDGMAFSIRDIAIEWNKVMGERLGLEIDLNVVPADWGLLDSSFYVAPESGTFNNIQYEQGFWIDTGIEFFGIEVDADIKVTSDDFEFHVGISIAQFEEFLRQEIALLDPAPRGGAVHVSNVTLSELSCSGLANGVDPLFTLHYNFLGEHTFTVRPPLIELYDGFHNFFEKFLKDLFN